MNEREAITVRISPELLQKAREVREDRESLNDVVIAAIDREVRRRQGLRAYESIQRLRAQIEEETGPQPLSGTVLRSLRDGAGRRD